MQERWVALKPRERQFALHYIDTANSVAAARLAGYTAPNANAMCVQASRLLHSSRIFPLIYAILLQRQLTPEYAELKLIEQLEATETKFFAHEGKVVETREAINWAARDAALDKLLKIHGKYKQPSGGDDTPRHVTIIYGHQVSAQTVVKLPGKPVENGKTAARLGNGHG